MSDEEIKKWTGGEIVDAEFTELEMKIESPGLELQKAITDTDAMIAAHMEDL